MVLVTIYYHEITSKKSLNMPDDEIKAIYAKISRVYPKDPA